MTVESIPVMTLHEFAEKEGLKLVVKERRTPLGDPARFYARFERAEVMENGCLVGVCGNGATPEQAASDYSDRISLRRLALNAFAPDNEPRREIEVPRLTSLPERPKPT